MEAAVLSCVSASSDAAIHGSGPLLPLNARIVYIGDSITALANWNGFPNIANIVDGGRYYTPNGYNLGVSGNTSGDILARLPSALALSPAVLVVEGGVNDTGGPPWATTIANLTSIYQQTLAAGVKVIAVTIFRDPSNADNLFVNNFIRTYPGISVADCTPGFNNPLMTFGGLHPNLIGAVFVGNIVASVLASLISTAPIFSITAGQLSPNPTMSGSIAPPAVGGNVVGTGVIPTGFRLYESGTTFTTSIIGSQDTASNGANEQIITITNGAGGTAFVNFDLPNITINGSTGDFFEAWSEMDVVQSNGLTAIAINFANSNLFPSGTVTSLLLLNGVYRTMPVALPGNQSTATWQATFQLAASGSCQIKIHNLMTRKVPAGQ